MRWLADELNEADVEGSGPYKEGNVYICRNCAIEMAKCQAFCGWCTNRIENQTQQLAEEESYG